MSKNRLFEVTTLYATEGSTHIVWAETGEEAMEIVRRDSVYVGGLDMECVELSYEKGIVASYWLGG